MKKDRSEDRPNFSIELFTFNPQDCAMDWINLAATNIALGKPCIRITNLQPKNERQNF
jgi:hypothetical protein